MKTKNFLSLLLIVLLTVSAFAQTSPTRIKFARGKKAASVSGAVGKYGKKEYVVGVKKSQTMDAKVISTCASVTLDVLYRESGESITDEPLPEFRNTLPSAGDYIIRVQNSDLPGCKFKLNVEIE